METHTWIVILHLLCAIIFIGFIFTDIFVLPVLNTKFSNEEVQKIKETIGSRAIKIFPLTVLVLIASGGMMFTKYVNSSLGYFETSLQQLLWIKVFLVLLIAAGIVYSLFCKFTKKKPFALMKHFHKFALTMTILIVIIAKLMFVV